MNQPTCIDLFCGCGGFSLGMKRAGFRMLAGIDFNPEAVKVFRTNFPEVKHVIEEDLTQYGPSQLAGLIGTKQVDVIVGGPPCQGFSTVRQRDGSNHGKRIVEDHRRYLYQDYLRYVDYFRPKVFVMENVLGIRSAAGGQYFTRVQYEARILGYRVHAKIEKAWLLGVPQKRQRQLIIGTRLDLPDYFCGDLEPAPRATSSPTLGEAIGDLPAIHAGGGQYEVDYDAGRRAKHIERYGDVYLYNTLEVHRSSVLTAHCARAHSLRDLRDFAKLREGENCTEAINRGVIFEFPYDRESFKDRYTRQHRKELCSTIVAHLSKDGLMFIHPTQNRSLTPREAARIQSFPDWFKFPVARTHQFRIIGNAVPPLVAESVGLAVNHYMKEADRHYHKKRMNLKILPQSPLEAVQWLFSLINATDGELLHRIPTEMFKRGWYSIGFLFHGLHPDSALEHGTEVSYATIRHPDLTEDESRLLSPFYVQSGWPVVLAPLAKEAWRRFEKSELKEEELYCSEAVIAGMTCATVVSINHLQEATV